MRLLEVKHIPYKITRKSGKIFRRTVRSNAFSKKNARGTAWILGGDFVSQRVMCSTYE